MQLRRSVVALVLLLQAVFSSASPGDSGLATNAEGGAFPEARNYWFSVGKRERLRLLLDGVEIYRGLGPAAAELPAAEGEERHYELIAQRLKPAPDDTLIESRTFLVAVDAKPPAAPELSAHARPQGGWVLSLKSETHARVDAIMAADGDLSVRRGLSDGEAIGGRSLSILAWAVDAAGNSSNCVTYEGKPFELAIGNPAAGRWANRQRLIVFSEGADEVFWTDDGSDPLGQGGRRYEGPVLIDAAGEIVVRVAARSQDGRVERREVAYSVTEAPEEPLGALRAAEETRILTDQVISIPASFRWDSAAAFSDGDTDAAELRYAAPTLTLRPVRGFERVFALLVGDSGLPQRFAFTLGERFVRGAASGTGPKTGATGSAAGDSPDDASPTLQSVGVARALVWPRVQGRVRYRLGSEDRWHDASAPVPVPASAVKVEWIVEDDTSSRGPFSMDLDAADGFSPGAPPVTSRAEGSSAAASVRLSSADGGETARFYLSLTDAIPGPVVTLAPTEELILDVCDGEALLWALRPESGHDRRSWMIDRAPPRRPLITAPAEGAWLTRGVEIAVAGEDSVRATVRRTLPSMTVETFDFTGSVRLEPSREGPESIRIEARSVDEAGNESPLVVREFTMDATTIYAGSARRSPEGGVDGSRDQPYPNLDEAIAAAKAKGLNRIRVLSDVTLQGRPALMDGLFLEGGFRSDGSASGGQSRVIASPGAGFVVSGASVTFRALSIESPGSSLPLLRAESGGSVKAIGCDLSGGDIVVEAYSAFLELSECRIVAGGAGESRVSALRAENSALSLDRCRLDVVSTAAIAAAIDCRGGSLSLRTVVADVRARLSAFTFVLRGTDLTAKEAEGVAVAADYASVLDAALSSIKWEGGRLQATARDAAVVTLDGCAGSFSAASFLVSSASSARALRVSGGFPSVVDSYLSSSPEARSAEAFSGTEPGPLSLAGNRFQGFALLWGRTYGAEDIAAFNRRFAPRDAANVIIDPEDAR